MPRLVVVCLLLVILAGAGAGAARVAAAPWSDRAPAPQGPAAVSWEGVLARTAELRGLTPRAEIPRTLLTREQLQAQVVDQLNRDPVPERLAASTKLLTALGLLERGTDLRGLLLQFRSGLVLGQYDPEAKRLYVVTASSALGPLERVTAVHEYTHALQDQYFDLLALRPRNAANGDRSLAIGALLEADATFVAERYAATSLSAADREERRRQVRELYRDIDLNRIPLVVREQSYFPYTEGPRFLRAVLGDEALRGEGYGAAVDALFRDPPQSTAQILHPERYLRRIPPVVVPLGEVATALGERWRLARQGVLGELDHRLIVQQYLDAQVAARAAAGWAGGSYALLEHEAGDIALAVRTRWDAPAEAEEWLDAYRAALQARYGAALAPLEESTGGPAAGRLWRTPDGTLLLASEGAETLLVLAPSAEDVRRLVARTTPPTPTALLPLPAARSAASGVAAWLAALR